MQLVKLLFLLVRRLNDRSNKIDDILPGAEFPHPDFVMATRKMHALMQVHLTTAYLLNGITRFLIKTLSYVSFFRVRNALHLVSKN